MNALYVNDPVGEDAELSFEVWSSISAELLQREPEERIERLEAHDLMPDVWEAADARWTLELATDVAAGKLDRARAYGRACAAELERRRDGAGASEPADTTGELRQPAPRAALPFGGERSKAFDEALRAPRGAGRSACDSRDETAAVPVLRVGDESCVLPFRTGGKQDDNVRPALLALKDRPS